MLIFELYIFTLVVAIIAYTYTEILTDHGMIFFRWKGWLFKKLKSDEHWLFKILVGCPYCVSGQMALWMYLYFVVFESLEYHWYVHISTVAITIFNVALIKKAGI